MKKSINLSFLHYIVGISSFVIVFMMIFSGSKDITTTYLGPKILSLTHIFILLFAGNLSIGFLYQIIHFAFKVEPKSIISGYITLILLTGGTILISTAFWRTFIAKNILLEIGGTMIFIAVFLFILNIFLSFRKIEKKTISEKFIITSTIWFLLTALGGIMMVVNASTGLLGKENPQLIKLHLHMGVIGWLIMLIIGILFKIFPLFFGNEIKNKKITNFAFYLSNLSLFSLVILHFIFENLIISSIVSGIFLLSIIIIMKELKSICRKKTSYLKISKFNEILIPLMIILSVLFFVLSVFSKENSIIYSIAYVASLLLGFITAFFYVIIPLTSSFINNYNSKSTSETNIENVNNYHMYFYFAGFCLFLSGIILQFPILINSSCGFFLISSIFLVKNLKDLMYSKQ